MDYPYFSEQLDLQWNSILQEYLDKFSCQNKERTLTFDDILKQLFVADQKTDYETKYEDKELCEKCIVDILNFLSSKPPIYTKQSFLCFLLNMAVYMTRDEPCFINLNVNNVLHNIIYLTQCTLPVADKSLKLLFGQLVLSSLEHVTGVKWVVEFQYWLHQYHMIVQLSDDTEITYLGFSVLTKLFEKCLQIDEKMYEQTIQVITKPLIETTVYFDTLKSSSENSFDVVGKLKPNIICLVEILQRLMENNSVDVLNQMLRTKVDSMCDQLSQKVTGKELVLVLRRITIILSFFALTQVFDGIKSINQDPLKLSGFIKICNDELEKGDLSVVLELYHYGIRYSKFIGNKLPKYSLKNKPLDMEDEILALQLEPIILVSDITNNYWLNPDKVETFRVSFLAQLFKGLSMETLHLGFKVRANMPSCPPEIYTIALHFIVKTKEYYSPKNLAQIFECLVYCLEDILKDMPIQKHKSNHPDHEKYVTTLLSTITGYVEEFNFDWGDRVKAMDLPQILFEILSVPYDWPHEIVVKALVLMKIAILNRLSPCMFLLIDTPESIKDIGPMLYRKCFNSEWEIRNAVLDVIHTIAYNANKTFSSFKELLVEASLISLVSTMTLNDENGLVKVTGFKCLQEFIVMEGVEHNLSTVSYINKVLNTITNDKDASVQSQAIKFIAVLYNHEENLPTHLVGEFYKCMERQALHNDQMEVRKASVEFWKTVTKKFFTGQGWIDRKFPSIVFSKRIVTMTKKEIRSRIYKILSELSHNGCLNVFKNLFDNNSNDLELTDILKEFLGKFYYIFREYDITEESMVMIGERSTTSSSKTCVDSYEIMQDFLNDTVMTMMPGDLHFCPEEELLMMLDAHPNTPPRPVPETIQKSDNVSPSSFVAFVFRMYDTDTSHPEEPSQAKYKDTYVIDY